MTRTLFALIFLLGATAVIWVGLGFLDANLLALTATLIIAAVYGLGFLELRHFRRATNNLIDQLRSPPANPGALDHWLTALPASLRGTVARRVDGEPIALPGPILTPYLSGLLVMLGLLGTFIGMIVTLRGAVTALEGGSELHAIRSALAAPIEGMSLAFGTSIAGVATSAMLGLAATLSRRDRLLAARELDSTIHQALRPFSLKHQRREAYQALQAQSQVLPEVVDKLHALAIHLERMGERLTSTLTNHQQQFHRSASNHYESLARSVGETLTHSLTESSRQAAQSIKPVMEEAMARLNQQVEDTHQRLHETVGKQLTEVTQRFQTTTEKAAQSWQAGLAEHQQSHTGLANGIDAALKAHNARFHRHGLELLKQTQDSHQQLQSTNEQHLAALIAHFQKATEQAVQNWQAGLVEQQQTSTALVSEIATTLQAHNEHFRHTATALLGGQQTGLNSLVARVGEELSSLRDQEDQHGEAARERLASLEETVSRHLASLGTALEAPMIRLIETASETPKAAAKVIIQLREEMAKNSERDNDLLEERRHLMAELGTLLSAQREATTTQSTAIKTLIFDSSRALTEVSHAFSSQADKHVDELNQIASEVTGSAHDVASLSDAFSLAVHLFSDANDKLVDNLQRIEVSLERSSARSDEQLSYYVEQAREVIDLSLTSQKDVLETLGALRQNSQPAPGGN